MKTYIHPFSAKGILKNWSKITGMESVLMKEIVVRKGTSAPPMVVVSNESEEMEPVHIRESAVQLCPLPIADIEDQRVMSRFWFDDLWAVMHPEAFRCEQVEVEQMKHFAADATSLYKRLDLRLEEVSASGALDRFAARFGTAIGSLQPGQELCWGDVFLFPAILRYCEELKALGIQQSLSCHLSIPETLTESACGRLILQAMSSTDRVYVHTDAYIARLEKQLVALSLPIPAIVRFDIGPDYRTIAGVLDRNSHPATSSLDHRQRALADDAFDTTGRIPHRFICLDRMDPIKGMHILLKAMDRLLTARQDEGVDVGSQYRFYFLMDYLTHSPATDTGDDADILWIQYVRYLRENLVPQMEAKWKGVFFCADNIPDKELVIHLLKDCHIISGGIQDGLNLSFQEGIFVNAHTRYGRTGIIGKGAGISMQSETAGLGALAHFTEPGSVEAMVQAFGSVLATPTEECRRRTIQLADAYESTRTTSVFTL